MASTYRVEYHHPILHYVTPLQFSTLEYARRQNEVGSLTMVLPPIYPLGTFVRDGQIRIHRAVDDGPSRLHLDTVWFINRIIYKKTEDGEELIELQAHDNTGLLARRVVAYDADNVYTKKTGYMDNVLKAIVRENFSTLAIDANRDSSWVLDVSLDYSGGLLMDADISWQNVFDVATKLAEASAEEGAKLLFDFVSLEDGAKPWEFRTWTLYRGSDHSSDSGQPVVFAEEFGNLSMPTVILDYTDEATCIYVPGKATTQTAIDLTRSWGSPWMRIERVINSNSDDTNVMADEAKAGLKKGRPRLMFEGKVLDGAPPRYGLHYDYGDLVTAQYMGFAFDCVVDSVHVTLDSENGEQLEILLKGDMILP